MLICFILRFEFSYVFEFQLFLLSLENVAEQNNPSWGLSLFSLTLFYNMY